MSYDLKLANRIRNLLEPGRNIIEKKMFGGVGYILNGNMACGILGNNLIVRIEPENQAAMLSRPFVGPFMGRPGKPMNGWILVAPDGVAADADLQKWVEIGYKYASSLPLKV
jgi:TfoX/Sxy family transcriptional regulator of competence genes